MINPEALPQTPGRVEEVARIVRTDATHAWVETERKSACGQCSSSSSCGTSALAKVLGHKVVRVRASNPKGYVSGDLVMVGISDQLLVKGTWLMYGLPLVGFMLGGLAGGGLAGVAGFVSMNDAASIIGAIVGLMAGLKVASRRHSNTLSSSEFEPRILRKAFVEETATPVQFMPRSPQDT